MLALLVGLLGLFSQQAVAQGLPAAGTGKDLWIVLPEAGKGLNVLHRYNTDEPGHFLKITTPQGMLTPGGIAAGGDFLWLVYSNQIVQSISLAHNQNLPGQVRDVTQFAPSLPHDVIVQSLAASDNELWALLQVHTASTLALLDRSTAVAQAAAQTDPAAVDDDSVIMSDEAATSQPATKPSDELSSPVTRLVRLYRSRWQTVPLPADWPQDQRAWIVFTRGSQSHPTLIVQTRLANADKTDGQVRVYHFQASTKTETAETASTTQPDKSSESGKAAKAAQSDKVSKPDEADQQPATQPAKDVSAETVDKAREAKQDDGQWVAHTYEAPTQGDIAFFALQQQLVMAVRVMDQTQMRVNLWVFRPERSQAVAIGKMEIDQSVTSSWAAVPDGLSAALIMRNGMALPQLTAMDLQGQVTHKPGAITIDKPPEFVQDPGQILLVSVVGISILLMFIIWRRDPNMMDIKLPKDVVLADFGRRLAAVAIDLVPCVLVVMFLFNVDLSELERTWPGRMGTWSSMIPGLLIIGLFVLHTGLSEIFMGKSMGKAVCGLKVISVTGQRPKLWQLVVRNLLKTFDLIACYVLPILMLVGKYRQRLGDLVGKTLVVMSNDPPKGPPEIDKDDHKRRDDPTKPLAPDDADKDASCDTPGDTSGGAGESDRK